MYDFHTDKKRYFHMQTDVTEKFVIPFITAHTSLKKNQRVLEIGCAEAGVLKAFINSGLQGVGVELSTSRFETATAYLADDIQKGSAMIVNKNIYDIRSVEEELGGRFDLIVLKDVIEHIPDQRKFIAHLHSFLTPGGRVFFAYPPWWMPFGGHQQICRNRFLQRAVWLHLLPASIYRFVLRLGGESEATIHELLDVKSTGIRIETMKRFIRQTEYQILSETYWLINPIYKAKFGLKPRKVTALFAHIPFLRNFYTTAHYILFSPQQQ